MLILQPMVSRPVCLGVEHQFGAYDQILISLCLSIIFIVLHIRLPLWREDRSIVSSAITHWSESHRTRNHTSLFHLRLARNRVAKLYLWALGSLFVASYDSQGYGGGILTSIHTGITHCLKYVTTSYIYVYIYSPGTGLSIPVMYTPRHCLRSVRAPSTVTHMRDINNYVP
jgi:hypothetical protein